MAKYRVQEIFMVTVWAYVEAKSKTAARDLFERGKGTTNYDEIIEWDYRDAFYPTLEEIKK